MRATEEHDFGKEMIKMLPRLMRSATRRDESVFSRGNITLSQMMLMEFLFESGSMPMRAIARTLGLTMSASTSVVDKMLKSGFLERERSVEDRRVVMVSLAVKGKKFAKNMRAAKVKMINNMYSALTSEEKDRYLMLIKKVYDNLED